MHKNISDPRIIADDSLVWLLAFGHEFLSLHACSGHEFLLTIYTARTNKLK